MKDEKSRIKAVIFDLDDTLYPEKDYVKSGYHCVARILNHVAQVNVGMQEQECHVSVEDVESKLWTAFMQGYPAIDKVLRDEGIYSEELKKKCIETYRLHKPTIRLYEGMKDTLISLRKKGIKLGIITDGRLESQRAKLDSLNLSSYFDEIIITDELGGIQYRKPNDYAFCRIHERLQLPFHEMVYIGDNPAKDLDAPAKLGMHVWWFRNKEGIYYNPSIENIEGVPVLNDVNEMINLCNRLTQV